MKSEKISLPLDHFPEQIRTYLEGATFYDSSSHSAASVFYAETGYYLKIDQKGQLAQEATLAKWFEKQGLGVSVIHYLTADKDYLLTKEAKGKDALAFLQQPEELCQTMAVTLRKLHSLQPQHFPIQSSIASNTIKSKQRKIIGKAAFIKKPCCLNFISKAVRKPTSLSKNRDTY